MQRVKKLVIKDLHLNRNLILKYIFGSFSLAAFFYFLGANQLAGFPSGQAGALIITQNTVAAFGLHILISTVFRERSNHSLSLTMSLPISMNDYTLAKIISNMGMFISVWIISVGAISLIVFYPFIDDNITPRTFGGMTAIFSQLILIFALVLAIAIITESFSWMMLTTGICGILYVNSFIYFEAFLGDGGVKIVTIETLAVFIALFAAVYLRNRRTVVI
jgi:ABC-type Na+ efflux pump permease subunit